ncbi:WD repeat-containing protein 43-like [Amphiura filiformis]|uniref:WD repeat-containing protein 43-like n=1 Tax=Amphiura filiformis TaxID=82378 RepID=UPI003B20CA4E
MAATWSSKCDYSPDVNSLAISSPDGRLTIWDTVGGTPKQQYTPSSHLSVTCTCLAWCPSRQQASPVRKRKKARRHRTDSCTSEPDTSHPVPSDVIALGTIAGHVMLYSVAKGDVHSQMSGGHNDRVNDVSWHPAEDVLYSASDDQQIVEWHIPTKSVKCKWKADKNAVHCICVCPGGKTLLSAGRTIQLWDLETKKVLKKFVGHASPVSRLKVAFTDSSVQDGGGIESVEGLYFLSSAVSDRVLNMWQVRSSSKDKTAMASFSVLEEPLQYDVFCTTEQTLYLAVVTNDGQVHIFDPILNGRSKKPLSARHTIQISTAGDKQNTPRPIPILAVQFISDREIIIAHGTFLKIVFEKIAFLSNEKSICLVREDPAKSHLQVDVSADKVKKPLATADAAVHGPTTLAPAKGAKRKQSRKQLTMEDRINALSIAQAVPETDLKKVPTSGTLVQLLTQGLQSQDKDMLERVFYHQKESVVTSTVRRLPVPLVIPLVKELITRMNTTSQRGLILALWVRCVLREHASYLMAVPELLHKLNTVYEMVHARTRTGGQLRRLQGKLGLMLAQIKSQGQQHEEDPSQAEALLVYQEDSSDEADLEEPLPIHSESEGEWEELSESEMETQEADDKAGEEDDNNAAESDEESDDDDEESSSMEADEEDDDQELTDPSSSSEEDE